jgi:bacteriorhodopsin
MVERYKGKEMTQDEIIKALRQVVEENTHYTTWTVSTPHLVLLVNLAIEKEREACAKVCEQTNDGTPYNLAEACAEAIRARGNHDTR